jgi:hypothetical protein
MTRLDTPPRMPARRFITTFGVISLLADSVFVHTVESQRSWSMDPGVSRQM